MLYFCPEAFLYPHPLLKSSKIHEKSASLTPYKFKQGIQTCLNSMKSTLMYVIYGNYNSISMLNFDFYSYIIKTTVS